MSHRPKSYRPKNARFSTRSKNTHVVVRGIPNDPPDYRYLVRAMVELAKDMQVAKDLDVSLEEANRERWRVKEDV